MSTERVPGLSKISDLLRNLADRPIIFLLVLLALNAIAQPYGGITHDTRLYSVQVANRVEPGLYSDDLFFRNGSQDQYSIFSTIMAPLSRVFGLKEAFFLVYLISSVMLIWALKRVVERLIADRALSTLALLFMVVAPLQYGAYDMLHVHETFLTPRLPAIALATWALSLVLDGSYKSALLVLIVAALVHPLMTVGGVLVWCGCLLYDKLGGHRAAWVLLGGIVAFVAILVTPSLASALFKTMDDEWRETIRRASPFIFLEEWHVDDWAKLAIALFSAAYLANLTRQSDPRQSRFALVVGLVGVAAVVGSEIAVRFPYALLVQGQPYRALWLLQILQVPAFLMLAAALWRTERLLPSCLSVAILTFFLMPHQFYLQWLFLLIAFPVVLVGCRGLKAEPRHPSWLLHTVIVTCGIGIVGWGLFKVLVLFSLHNPLRVNVDSVEGIRNVLIQIGALPVLIAAFAVISWATRTKREAWIVPIACTLFVFVQTAFAMIPRLEYVQRNHTRDLADVLFVREYLDNTWEKRPVELPTVYSPFGRVELVWLEMKAKCYFDWWQTGGFMFHRETAIEGQRRALVAAPFEIGRFRERIDTIDDHFKHDIERFLGQKLDGPPPTLDDLIRLCQEPGLNYVVLKDEFPGLYSASNGRLYIYECEQVRAATVGSE